jgi:anthranilate phosphoribosyltransferase
VLEFLGVDLAMDPDGVCRCIEEVGIGFLYAPGFHPAMKRVMGARKELGIPTIFNILGPLTNPAGATAQVIGVNRPGLLPLMGEVLLELGCDRGFVLHGADGMDEFTLAATTQVCEVHHGSTTTYEIAPEDIGVERCRPEELAGGDVRCNARILEEALRVPGGPRSEICVANAAFAIVAGGAAPSVEEGVRLARDTVRSGSALRVLERLVACSKAEH